MRGLIFENLFIVFIRTVLFSEMDFKKIAEIYRLFEEIKMEINGGG